MLNSVEEKIEDYIKDQLTKLGLKYYTKNEMINAEIEKALKLFPSKNGGKGGCIPDIKLLIDNIPVMIEVKGKFEDIRKLRITSGFSEEMDMSESAIQKYALNGAIHYAHALLTYTNYDRIIAIGIAGNTIYNGKINPNTYIWSYLVTKENTTFLQNVSKKNDLNYLVNLKDYIEKGIFND